MVVQAMIIVTSAMVDICHSGLKSDDELESDRYRPNDKGTEHNDSEKG